MLPLHSITGKLATCLIIAAAASQGSAYGLDARSHHSNSALIEQKLPIEQKLSIEQTPPIEQKLSIAQKPPTEQTPPIPQKQILAALPPPDARLPSSHRPFGQMSLPVASGDVVDNWHLVRTEIDGESAVLDRCRAQQECSKAARAFLDIVAQGRGADGMARLGVINRAVNLAIVPTSDMKQWGVADHWSPPLETLTTGRGDCEDYAILKYVALIDAGVPKQDVKLVIVHNRFPDEEHAVVAARIDDRWFILDNRSLALVPDAAVRGETPLFVLDDAGTEMFVTGPMGGLS
ncbi:MAG TPA: transglutaminase-like cysteine peptidase [Xanthobacteraceae bacterium]|jgi:predicted transglutaminase-like cysteine proteinase|nr:transglutaminase-like cysteine peptidase [Xanthobacteraceae bacterium]